MFLYVYFFYQYPPLPNIFINYSSSLSYAHVLLLCIHTNPAILTLPHYDYSHSLVTARHNILSLFIRIHILSIYPTIEINLALLHHCQRLHSLLFLNGLSLLPWPYSSMCLLFAYIPPLLNDSLQH